jgi:hypothetical protein
VAKAHASLDVVAERRPTDPTFLVQAAMIADEQLYFDHFTALFSRSAQTRLTMDITPGYALLSAERLSSVRAAFEQRGVRAVAAYLLRDPVERIWSASRMDMRRRGDEAPEDPETRVSHMYKHPMYADRTRYDLTMDALEQAFPREDVFYGFYERLFTSETLAPLCNLLGIDYQEPDTGRQVNVSPKSEGAALPEDTRRTIARHFTVVYDAVQRRFPDLDLAALWPSARLL